MRFRPAITVGALCLWAAASGWAEGDDPARLVSVYVWDRPEEWFGGFSGMEVAPDGEAFLMVTDRGRFVEGRFVRDAQGKILGVDYLGMETVKNAAGKLPRPYERNSEGLARDAAGGPIFVCFEGEHKVEAFDAPGAPAQSLPALPGTEALSRNEGLEAIAIDPLGRLVVVAEGQAGDGQGFPVWRLEDGTWRIIHNIPREGGFRPVGADFGPDGRFYLLERSFNVVGFSSRARRFDIEDGRLVRGQALFRAATGVHDNLEALSVWRDAEGALRLTMVSDDNFFALQRTEIVEYVIDETP
jgi:hypothetical protein